MSDDKKPLPSDKKQEQAPDAKERGEGLRLEASPSSALMAPLAGSSVNVTKSDRLTSEAWNSELTRDKNKPWNATAKGRLAIRLFSRGLMGAIFYTAGKRYAKWSMGPDVRGLGGFKPGGELNPKKPLQYVAAGIDRFVGRPLEHLYTAITHDPKKGKMFVTFSPTKFFYGSVAGRTLGHEVVTLTTDFASMSVGDAVGRDIAEALDPNVKHDWIDPKGHINYSNTAKAVGKNIWKYATYSAGEDWAVAIPYAFWVREQGRWIDKASPGFRYDQDRRLNGGSFKVDEHGKIVGSYALEGALDLQGRFTMYNIGTLMFRETYAEVGKGLRSWYQSGFKLPQGPASVNDAVHGTVDALGKVSRWALRDTIKATMYMTPSVPFFWMFRTPQSHFRGTFIHPDKGMIAYNMTNSMKTLQAVHANEHSRSTNKLKPDHLKFHRNVDTFFASTNRRGVTHIEKGNVTNPFLTYGKPFEGGARYKIDTYSYNYNWLDKALNPVVGRVNNAVRQEFHAPVNYVRDQWGFNLDSGKVRMKGMTDDFVNAAFSYTPYFMMKNDIMAYNWDNAKMDMAIERMVDGVTHFNGKEVKEGIGETWASMQTWREKDGVPFNDPKREVLAQKAICDDESPPDGQNFYANSQCFDQALQDIEQHTDYRQNRDTEQFVERLKDSRKRSKGMLDQFREDIAGVSQRFTDFVQPRSQVDGTWNTPDPDMSHAAKQRLRKARSLDDFPDVNTTVH